MRDVNQTYVLARKHLRTVSDEKILQVNKLTKDGLTIRKACEIIGVKYSTYTSITSRGYRTDVIGSDQQKQEVKEIHEKLSQKKHTIYISLPETDYAVLRSLASSQGLSVHGLVKKVVYKELV